VVASIDRTAYPRFKRVVSARELAESFTPTAEEITWARGRTHTGGQLLSLVVLLKCYQRLGYFPKLRDVPPLVVGHIRVALGVDADIAAGQESQRTLWRHRDFVRTRAGTGYEPGNEDIRCFAHLIRAGNDSGQLSVARPEATALPIMILVDGLSVQSAIRGALDYTDVRSLVTAVTEQILGLRLEADGAY